MNVVYRAHADQPEGWVAIKAPLPHCLVHPESMARFHAEARALARVRHHNVVGFHHLHQEDGQHFMVLEYVRGHSLEHLVAEATARCHWLALSSVQDILGQLAAALAAVHAAGVAHRDVKPANMMVENDSLRLVLMDFGLAHLEEADDSSYLQPSGGTPGYVAPELLMADHLTLAADCLGDVYSFGITAFELLTGRRPYRGDHLAEVVKRQVTESVRAPSMVRRDVPSWLDRLVVRCLAPEPAQRLESAAAVHRTLSQALLDEGRSTPPDGPGGVVATIPMAC
jgi:serine/threonine-protein kinase